jgi:hypothetical protein
MLFHFGDAGYIREIAGTAITHVILLFKKRTRHFTPPVAL